MKKSTMIAATVLSALVLGGCQAMREGITPQYSACEAKTEFDVAALDWKTAEAKPVEIGIRDRQFTNGVIVMKMGQPYVIRVTNHDEKLSGFDANDFFRSSVVVAASYDGMASSTDCPSSVMIASGKAAEFKIVPMERGVHSFSSEPRRAITLYKALNAAQTGSILVN